MIEHLFTTPVYNRVLSSDRLQLVSQEINNALSVIRQSDLTNPWDDNMPTTYKYSSVNDVHKYNLQGLRNNMLEHLGVYLRDLGLDRAYKADLLESWFNFGGRGTYQAAHRHPFSTLSAVYYHQTNGQDGNICFKAPCAAHSAFVLWQFTNAVTTKDAVVISPQVGKIIIFPSYLLHMVYENKTEDERISVAFNFSVQVQN
jgi:uncharacterized protein (TIGR02466 family)